MCFFHELYHRHLFFGKEYCTKPHHISPRSDHLLKEERIVSEAKITDSYWITKTNVQLLSFL